MFGWLCNRNRVLADRELLGRWGEKRCEKFLRKKGYKKLAANFLCKTGEIDLVMVDGDGALVFVEVKTRADETFAPIETVVTGAKKVRMIRAARYFLSKNNIDERPFRFDVVMILAAVKGKVEIRHYENAFVP